MVGVALQPVVGEIIPQSEYARLAEAKEKIAYWLQIGQRSLFEVADYVRLIEEEALFRFDLNPDSGEPFHSMSEYYPHLISELKSNSQMHKLSERLVREFIRLDKVFVHSLGIPRERILEDGVSLYTELAEAMDYDHRTGQVYDKPREGKLGKDEALQILQESKESGWSLESVREELDQRRGVQRRSVSVEWHRTPGGRYILSEVLIHDGDTVADADTGLSLELAKWLTKRLGASSNLPKEV